MDATIAHDNYQHDQLSELKSINVNITRILGIVEISKQLLAENLRLRQESPSPQVIPEPQAQPPLPRNVRMTKIDDNIYISGDTYDIRQTLKTYGGEWISSEKKWKVPEVHLDELATSLKAQNVDLTITEMKPRQDYDEVTLRTDDL